jgi:Ca2+-binding RTX toxin-like protein
MTIDRYRAPRSRLIITVVAAALLATALPAIASADVASSDGTTMTVRGSDGNEHIILSIARPGVVAVNTDEAGSGCTPNQYTENVECPLGPGGVRVDMAGGDDRVTNLDLSDGSLPDGALVVDLGAGNDHFTGSHVAETVSGGPGDDELELREGDDHADAGDGNDTLIGGGGRDILRGDAGDDTLDGDLFDAPAADLIDGGPGNDKAVGWTIPDEDVQQPIGVTLNGAADDGRPGEGDDVRDIERFTSNISGTLVTSDAPDVIEMWANLDYGISTIHTLGGNDVITAGSSGENIDAGAGDDRIEAGYGDDTIVGGPGRDSINADKSGGSCGLFETCYLPFGNDVIDIRDGGPDSLTCGPGSDTVTADAVDTVAPDCEAVTRDGASAPGGTGSDPAGGGAGGTGAALKASIVKVKLGRALSRGLAVRITAPTAGRLSATAKAGRKRVAAGSRTVKKAGRTTVTLRFAPKQRRKLRHAHRVKLSVAVRFSPKNGAKVSRTLAAKLTR